MDGIGIDFKIKPITLDGKTIKLQVWDTAGQERFRTITQTYYKGAMGIILAYDCTDPNSFASVTSWIKQIDAHANPGVVKVLVGNKCDRPDRKIDSARGKALADANKMAFFETSAKTKINIVETFYHIAREIKAKYVPPALTPGAVRISTGVAPKKDEHKKSACC